MFIIYDLVFLLFSLIYLPVYLLKRKFHPGFNLRLGVLPKDLKLDNPIWIHAVSVGEAMSLRLLVETLRNTYPGKKFVISTVTPTGNKIAKGLAGEGDFVTYLPLDFSFIVRKVINKIHPSVFIIAETELWPNLIAYLYKKNTPVVIVNGRISDSSLGGYLIIKFFIKDILRKISLFCVQSERDAIRFKALGADQEKIKVTGNTKFDIADYTDKESANCMELKKELGLKNEEKVFIAASTHDGEEEIILNCYKKLSASFADLTLIIAPRHPERSRDIERIVSKLGMRSVFISALPKSCNSCITKPVFILDVIGKLINFYAISDIVFVGGSLIKKGGHNILEPAFLAKPIIFGPYTFNFRDIVDLFLTNESAILVNDQDELNTKILYLLNHPLEAIELGQKAKKLVQQNQGATARNIEFIRKIVV